MKRYLFFVFFATILFTLNAQTKSELQIGLAIPQGDFADDDEDDAIFDGSGVAATGLYFGYKILSPLNADKLFWTLNAGIMYNDLQRDFKDDLEEEMEGYDENILPKYLNIPLFFGLQYEGSVADNLGLFGEAGLGVNILKITNWTASGDDSYGDYETSVDFEPSVSLGYKIAAGIVLQDKYTITLNYVSLGSHKVKYEYEIESYGLKDKDDDKFDKALSVSSMNITFGFRF